MRTNGFAAALQTRMTMLDHSAAKLLAFPAKVESILRQGIDDSSYPLSVELSLTNRCNLGCRWCGDSSLRARNPGEIPTSLVKRLLDELLAGGTRGVVIEGGGEPTIHPGFREIVSYVGQIGLAAGLVTNGLSTKPMEIAHRLEWIRVSLDASTPEEYLLEKGKDCFERVLSNLAHL
jgi:MoaA/NifB/PqqE/SkfB family radical SAM enzyme